MIPVCLEDMINHKETDGDIYEEMMQCNWDVNRNAHTSFCAVGAMKVDGGLVGIIVNQHASTKFFLVSPELARLSEEAENMASLSPDVQFSHHSLST